MTSVRQECAKDGSPVFLLEHGGRTTALSSRHNPAQEARHMVDGETPEGVHVVVVFGAGHLALLLEAARLHPEAVLVVGDPLPELLAAFLAALPPALASRVLGIGPGDEHKLTPLFLEQSSRKVRFLHLRTRITSDPLWFDGFKREVIRLHDKKSINLNTMGRFERLWLRNITRNTVPIALSAGMHDLAGMGRGHRGVLVAAGPSLAQDLPILKANQHKVLIVAVDTAYAILRRHGIKPHVVVVVDPQKVNSRYIEGPGTEGDRDTVFLAEPAICPMGLRGREDRTVMFNTIFPWYHLVATHFGERGQLDLGGSVATTAFDFCLRLGLDETLILGLDLCFSRDAYHVPGTHYEGDWVARVRRLKTWEMQTFRLLDLAACTPARDEKGKAVWLDSRFTLFRKWFEDRLSDRDVAARFKGGMKGVAPIAGLSYVDAAGFLEPLKEDLALAPGILRRVKSACARQKANLAGAWPGFLRNLGELRPHLVQFHDSAKEAMETARGAIPLAKMGKPVPQALARLDRLDRALAADFPGKILINIVVQQAIQKVEIGNGTAADAAEALAQSLALYEAMADAADLQVRSLDRVARQGMGP